MEIASDLQTSVYTRNVYTYQYMSQGNNEKKKFFLWQNPQNNRDQPKSKRGLEEQLLAQPVWLENRNLVMLKIVKMWAAEIIAYIWI